MPDHDGQIAEQIAYYRARAPEYDQWWQRTGRYDRGVETNSRFIGEAAQVAAEFERLTLDGAHVLELAPGTGIWTERIVRRARQVTVIDASPEMLERCRQRLGPLASAVEFVLADLFEWSPTTTYDALVFCFWISHIPDHRLNAFLAKLASAARGDAAVFFLDALPEPTSTAGDHTLPDPDGEVMTRRLNDGRSFRIVKNFWPDDELVRRFASAGFDIEIYHTATYFQYGFGTRR